MIDDLQWKRGPTMGLNEQFGGCCVGQEGLYTSMRQGLKRITATVTEPSI